MEERRVRIGSLFEWMAAVLGVLAIVWLVAGPVQRLLGPQIEAVLVDTPARLPPGVPAGARSVPVMLLLDGREIRAGDIQARVNTLLPDRLAEGSAHVTTGEFGDQQTRMYYVDGVRFYVVCEPLERGGPMRVTGIYVP